MVELLKRIITSNRQRVFISDIQIKLTGVGTSVDLLQLTDQLGKPFTVEKLAASEDLDIAIANGDVTLTDQNGTTLTGIDAFEATNLLTLNEVGSGTSTVEDLPDLGDVDDSVSPTLGSLLKGDGSEWDEFPLGSGDEILGINGGGTDLEYKELVAGTNVSIVHAAGTITISSTGGVSAHDLLSLTHSDTVAQAVVRGDIIYGNSTPAWDALSIGASGTFLRSDGTDPSWTSISASDLPAHATTHERGGTDEIDGDIIDIDFVPTNYTRDTTPAEVTDVEHLTAHLSGIDSALATALSHDLLSTTHSDTVTASVVRGDIIIGNSTPSWDRLATGSSAEYLRSDGTDPSWSALLAADLSGIVAIVNGGTGSSTALGAFNNLSPLTTRGDILTRDASNNIRLAIGGSGTFLRSDGTDPLWSSISVSDLPAHSSTHIKDGTDEIDGDQIDIDFNPTNYVPDTSPPEVTDVDHLSAHLAGIDTGILNATTYGYGYADGSISSISFFDLFDVAETTFSGSAGEAVIVNPTEDALIFGTVSATPTLADISSNSTTALDSLYTMTTGIDIEFRTAAGDNNPLLYLDEDIETIGIGISTGIDAKLTIGDVGTRAPLELPNLVSAPSTGLGAGQLSVIDEILYLYDSSRSKTLSVSEKAWQWGRNGATDSVYLRFGGNATNSGTGAKAERDGTIVGIAATSSGGNATKTFDIEINGVLDSSFSLTSNNFRDETADIDFDQDDVINIFVSGTGASVANPTVILTVRWRV